MMRAVLGAAEAVLSPPFASSPAGLLHRLPLRAYLGWSLAVAAATLLTRVPLASRYLYSWDSANFAFALDEYSVPVHQPHPPGYPLYVAAGWLLRLVLGDANAAFVALSIGASVAAGVLLLGLAWRMLGRGGALVAVLLFSASPNTWGHGLVAYPYAFLALVSSAVAWTTLETRWGRRDLSLLGALILGLGGGFRPDLLPLLGPLWLYGAWVRGPRVVLRGAVALLAVVAVWLLPMLERSGGWGPYLAASSAYGSFWSVPTDSLAAFVRGVGANVALVISYLYQSSGLVPMALLVYGVGRVLAPPLLRARPQLRLLLVWALPPFAFYTLVHIGNLGYLLSVLPALAILMAGAAEAFGSDLAGELRHPLRRAPIVVALATAGAVTSAAHFLLVPGLVSLREVRQIDVELADSVALLRELPVDSTLVVSFDYYRQLAYYLPEYRRADHLVSGLSLVWEDRDARQFTVDPPADVHRVVLPDLQRNTNPDAEQVVEVVSPRGTRVYVAQLDPGERLRVGRHYARVIPAGANE